MATKETVLNGWKEELATAADGATKTIANAADRASDAIAVAAGRAIEALSTAAVKATEALASAALVASKVVSTNAATATESQKDVVKTSAIDHDLLVRLDTKMEVMIADVKTWKDDTFKKIDHIELSKLEVIDSYPKLYKDVVEKRLDAVEKDKLNKDPIEKAINDNKDDIKALQLLSVRIMTWGGIIMFLIAMADIGMKFIK